MPLLDRVSIEFRFPVDILCPEVCPLARRSLIYGILHINNREWRRVALDYCTEEKRNVMRTLKDLKS